MAEASAKTRDPKPRAAKAPPPQVVKAAPKELGPDAGLGTFGADVLCRNRECLRPMLTRGVYAFVLQQDHAPFQKGDHVCCVCADDVHPHMKLRVVGLKKRLAGGGYNDAAIINATQGKPKPGRANRQPAHPRM